MNYIHQTLPHLPDSPGQKQYFSTGQHVPDAPPLGSCPRPHPYGQHAAGQECQLQLFGFQRCHAPSLRSAEQPHCESSDCHTLCCVNHRLVNRIFRRKDPSGIHHCISIVIGHPLETNICSPQGSLNIYILCQAHILE